MEKSTVPQNIPFFSDPFRFILLDHNQRYPHWQMEDIYKMIHQAALGSEHAVKNIPAVQNWMERELAIMGEGPEEPLLDPIRPDRSILRIHLRPYVGMHGDPRALVEAFISTANRFKGSIDDLENFWATARQMAVERKLPVKPTEMDSLFDKAKKEGFPAHEHSSIFEKLYRPAYRVVAAEFVASLHLLN